jgi:MFS family permease
VLDVVQLWHIYVLALLQGLVNSVDTPARQAFSVELVERDDVVSAVALNSVLFNAARIVGPAGAGLLIAWIGIGPVLLLNAASFAGPIWALLAMDHSQLRASGKPADGSIAMRLREGLRYTWRTPDVLLIMIVVAAIGTFGYNFSVTIPLIAGFVLRTDSVGFGGLMTALGIGSLAAALVTASAKQVTERRLLVSSAAFGLLLAAVALSPSYTFSLALLAALGFAGVSFGTSANSLLQLKVPTELRGRVVSLYFLLFAGTTPIGGLLIGAGSDAFGVPAALLLCAALCVIGVGAALVYRRRLTISD